MTRRQDELPPDEAAILGLYPEDSVAAEKAEEVAAEKAEFRKVQLANLMRQDWFREWLMSTLIDLGTFQSIHAAVNGMAPDYKATDYYLGRRSAGWDLWATFDDIAPELASLMRREASGKA